MSRRQEGNTENITGRRASGQRGERISEWALAALLAASYFRPRLERIFTTLAPLRVILARRPPLGVVGT